jgi:F-type H+-transporting ATPase subunit alpha
MDDAHGGGSLTALPIIETQAGDVSAYVPTNVISITDGQIYLETELFMSGIRPAVNAGLSVSRVGGAAQTKAVRSVGGRLRLDLAQYRELVTFAQFGTADLDAATRSQLERGQRATEVLKQDHSVPLSMEQQVVILFALVNGHLDDVEIPRVTAFEHALRGFMESNHPDMVAKIADEKQLSDELESALTAAITEFKSSVPY